MLRRPRRRRAEIFTAWAANRRRRDAGLASTSSFAFDGTNQIADLPDSLYDALDADGPHKQAVIVTWVKTTSAPATNDALWSLRMDSSGRIAWLINKASGMDFAWNDPAKYARTSEDPVTDAWQLLVCRLNRNTNTAYIYRKNLADSALVDITDSQGATGSDWTYGDASKRITIAGTATGSQAWPGRFAEWAIFATDSTDAGWWGAAELAELHSAHKPADLTAHSLSADLFAWYRFGDATTGTDDPAGTLYDESGNGHHATCPNGATLVSDAP